MHFRNENCKNEKERCVSKCIFRTLSGKLMFLVSCGPWVVGQIGGKGKNAKKKKKKLEAEMNHCIIAYWYPAGFFLLQTFQLFQKSEPIEVNSKMLFLVSSLYSGRITSENISRNLSYRIIYYFLLILCFYLTLEIRIISYFMGYNRKCICWM